MLESNAQNVWCPKALVYKEYPMYGGTGLVAINRTPGGTTGPFPWGTECLGSKCAVWVPKPSCFDIPDSARSGYCGLISGGGK